MALSGYYSDGVTKFTDPFYQCVCRKCVHRFWGITITANCPKCGCEDVFRSFSQEEAEAELSRLKNK